MFELGRSSTPSAHRSLTLWLSGIVLGTLLQCGSLVSQSSGQVVDWVWCGSVTDHAAVVKARLADPNETARLILSDGSRTVQKTAFTEADRAGVVAFHLGGLQEGTRYRYEIQSAERRSTPGWFKTFRRGPFSFKLVFGSCSSTGSNHRIFSTMEALEPDLFIHMGDFHYENISVNDPARFRKAFDRSLTAPRQAEFYRRIPVAYVWDDHDYGANDSDRESPSRPAALHTYQEYVPHYPLTLCEGRVKTIQQAFTIGRIRFIMTDGRADRSPTHEPDGPGKSMLGLTQRHWLEMQLKHSAARFPLVVWVNVVPWITKATPNSDQGWEPYSWERTHFANLIKKLGLVDRFLILSGDAHMVAADDGTHSNYASDQKPGEPAFPVFHAAPIDRYPRIKGGPYSQGAIAPRRLFGLLKIKQFGLMDVQDNGVSLRVRLSGHNSRGEPLPGMQLNLECFDRHCRVLKSPGNPTRFP